MIQKLKCSELKEKLKVNEISAGALLETLFGEEYEKYNVAVDKEVLAHSDQIDLDSSATIVTFPVAAGG